MMVLPTISQPIISSYPEFPFFFFSHGKDDLCNYLNHLLIFLNFYARIFFSQKFQFPINM